MNRQTERIVYGAILAVLLIVAIIIVAAGRRDVAVSREEIGRLENQIHSMGQSNQGGAETAPPAIEPVESEYRFPIARSDYLTLTSPFGYRISPLLGIELYHNGVDIAAAWHAQVVAVADGIVVEHWPPPDGYFRGHEVFGGFVVIEHANGWRSLYGHLSWTRVHTGDRVTAGEVIGRVGDTGQSHGQHLHLELHTPDDLAVNPLLYVETLYGRSES